MNENASQRYTAALTRGEGLQHDFIYSLPFNDYKSFPDPFPRVTFTVREVERRIRRYPDPAEKGELFAWDIHGRLLTPAQTSIPGIAVVLIHGGAANEYEFLFTPDGPDEYADLTANPAAESRVGIAQHIASLGIPVLAISLPGHYSRHPWPPISERLPEFIIGEVPSDVELKNRLAVYTFRMCIEAIKALIETSLPDQEIICLGHSTGGEIPFLLEQWRLKNKLIGIFGFGSGAPAYVRKEWALHCSKASPDEPLARFGDVADLFRRSPSGYTKNGYVGPNQPWKTAERWFELENSRRPQFKPKLQTIEHKGLDILLPDIRRLSGLADDEFFITLRSDLNRLHGKKVLYFVGEYDSFHWAVGGNRTTGARRSHWTRQKDVECRFEVYACTRLASYADALRLVVIPNLTHYGHIESYNHGLASLMVGSIRDYFANR